MSHDKVLAPVAPGELVVAPGAMSASMTGMSDISVHSFNGSMHSAKVAPSDEEQALGAASPGAPGPKPGNRSDCVRMTNLIKKLNQTTSPVPLPLVTGPR